MQTATDIASTCVSLATLLDYPHTDYGQNVAACRSRLETAYPAAAAALDELLSNVQGTDVGSLEETYTRTFDMAPICLPYVTSYIWGDENFERGKLMAGLAEAYARLGFDAGGELPDHLAVLLRFIKHLDDGERADLVNYCLRKPVAEMVASLDGAGNLYAPALRAVQLVLERAFPEVTGDD